MNDIPIRRTDGQPLLPTLDPDDTAYLLSNPENARRLREALDQASRKEGDQVDMDALLAASSFGPGNPPPEDDGFLTVDTYTTGPNLRVVALECASRACAPAGGSSGIRTKTAQELTGYATTLLAWLEAEE